MSVETKIDWNELDKEAKEDNSKQATDELKKFEEIKQKERSDATRRMVEAFSDCG